ncbi:MAG: SLBB domain-containing protein [Spirochaetales bacterium]|nr:SLBB domain-containing protein [Spirochaetales bacterium]
MKQSDYFLKFKNLSPSIKGYQRANGYTGLKKALTMTPDQIVEKIENAWLLGRGGAGFPTAVKWKTATREAPSYLVCNADEGEPGTFKDRFIMTHSPHMMIEGMIIAAYAVGANKGYIYIRGEYPKIAEQLEKTLQEADDAGFLGENITAGFSFTIDIIKGGGSYVVGDETALLNSLMGNRGIPWSKPPFPSEKGLWDRPTFINNVETLACAALILQYGSDWFRSIGSHHSPGPKLYCLSGKVNNPGIYEAPMGSTVKDLISMAGGVVGTLKAVQIGGTAGPIYTSEALDFHLDFDSMKKRDGIFGSGAVVVMNTDISMAEVLEVAMRFFAEESCGKCFPCRYGTRQLSYMADSIVLGKGKREFLDLMVETADIMRGSSFCPFGKSVEMPVKSILKNFNGELQALIRQKNYIREAL